jgi:hypothetical protein
MNSNKFIFLLFTLIFLTTCGKDDSVNCECEKLPNADFTISQGLGWNEDRRYFESDTFLDYEIKVEAINTLSSYNWTLGLDPSSWDSKSVELDFTDNFGDIEVTLIGEWTPNNDCFPNDNGMDTVSKTFHIVSVWESLFLGNYSGFCESTPNEIFNISIKLDSNGLIGWIENLPNGCNTEEWDLLIGGSTYKHFLMPDYIPGIPCSLPKGFGSLGDDNKTLTIEYEIWDQATNTKISDKFIGTKI